MVEKKITVSGALRSRIQVERIVETLRREFPEHEIESTLVVDNGRMGVGWGNRVADEFLVMFFQKVNPAKVTYRDTVLTLDGTVKRSVNPRGGSRATRSPSGGPRPAAAATGGARRRRRG